MYFTQIPCWRKRFTSQDSHLGLVLHCSFSLVIHNFAPTGRGAFLYETKTAARETNLGHAQV